MKKVLAGIFVSAMSMTGFAQQLAFPGAEGFGRFATGGRGCEVYHVTNLNDSGAGSLRDAVSQPNRTVVFDVSGVIRLKSRIVFSKNLTVAGQTAPGNGVVVYGYGVSFSAADNVIIRHMRFRMGIGGNPNVDAVGLANGKNMIFDHLSVSWGLDENFSINWDNKGSEPADITIQNSIIGQGILVHAMGGLMQTNGGVSILKNLYIDNKSRNPKVKGLNQFVNNVIYNWGSDGYILGGSAGDSWATIEDCYFIKGPNSSSPFSRATETFQVFQKGNMLDGNLDGVLNGALAVNSDLGPATFVSSYDGFNGSPKRHPDITDQMSAADAYHHVVEYSGASLPQRDEVDAYMIDELVSLGKKGAHIGGEHELGLLNNVGMFYRAEAYLDTDGDGIPDFWEDANGLDKNNPEDGKEIREDGYSNLEHYINSISVGKPFLKYPITMSVTNVSTDSYRLKWDCFENQHDKTILEISEDGKEFKVLAELDPEVLYYDIKDLQEKTKYYFRLKTKNEALESEYSDVYSATTLGAPGAPEPSVVKYPLDGTFVSDYEEITLNWTNPTSIDAGFHYFWTYIGTDPDNMECIQDSTTAARITVPVLPNTTYYWRVDCANLLGKEEGNLWSFTTGSAPVRTKVLYYPFDETEGSVIDNSTEGLDSPIVNYFVPTWGKGVHNNCISFPGTPTNQQIVQQSSEEFEFGTEAFTIDLWFKAPKVTSVDWYLFHKGSHTKNTSTGATGRWYALQYKNSTLYFSVDDDVTKSTASVTASSYFNQEWHHVACVRDTENKKLLLYIDGELQASANDATVNSIASTEDLILGNCNVNFNTPYQGMMDEFTIYNSALEAREIKSIYQAGVNSLTSIATTKTENLKLYPNPFRDRLTVDGLASEDNQIIVYDCAGMQVYSSMVYSDGSGKAELELGSLKAGFYTLVVKNNKGIRSYKIVRSKN